MEELHVYIAREGACCRHETSASITFFAGDKGQVPLPGQQSHRGAAQAKDPLLPIM